ncbi:hypothetical protein, partial [uncultured Gemmiger sp.]|uniref:hypothetical protein n=1 Tax=uncultured Gemmiger sp. TaxID=1623490 RepID=UPI0027DC4381
APPTRSRLTAPPKKCGENLWLLQYYGSSVGAAYMPPVQSSRQINLPGKPRGRAMLAPTIQKRIEPSKKYALYKMCPFSGHTKFIIFYLLS